MTTEMKNEIVKLYLSGLSQAEIARKFNTLGPIVRDVLVYSGVVKFESDFDRLDGSLIADFDSLMDRIVYTRSVMRVGDEFILKSPKYNKYPYNIKPSRGVVVSKSHPRFCLLRLEKSGVFESVMWEDVKINSDGRGWCN